MSQTIELKTQNILSTMATKANEDSASIGMDLGKVDRLFYLREKARLCGEKSEALEYGTTFETMHKGLVKDLCDSVISGQDKATQARQVVLSEMIHLFNGLQATQERMEENQKTS